MQYFFIRGLRQLYRNKRYSRVGITNTASSSIWLLVHDQDDVARDCFLNPIIQERFSMVGRELTSAFAR